MPLIVVKCAPHETIEVQWSAWSGCADGVGALLGNLRFGKAIVGSERGPGAPAVVALGRTEIGRT
ncbi:MAG: hypothetical protein ACYCV7_11375, partial [Acidimicrobiales bacterium]